MSHATVFDFLDLIEVENSLKRDERHHLSDVELECNKDELKSGDFGERRAPIPVSG